MTEPLQVVMDMTFPNRNPAGTGVYARELIAALGKRDDVHVTTVSSNRAGFPSTMRWLLVGAQASMLNARLLHCPASVAPWRLRVPVVLTVHDTMANEVREDHPLEWRAYASLVMPARARSADQVIVGSHGLRDEIIKLWRVSPQHIRVTPYGIAKRFFTSTAHAISRPPVMLLPGAPILRKNLELVLGAMSQAPEGSVLRQATLSISGARAAQFGRHAERIRDLNLESRVNWLGRIADEEMPALVAGVDLVVYPSLHEGFGFPALEAMAAGTPVLASSAPCLPEVLSDGATFVGPTDVKGFIQAAEALLTNEVLRQEMIGRGRRRAAQFTWERCADLTVEVYREAIHAS